MLCFVLAIHRKISKVIFVIGNVNVQTTKIALYAVLYLTVQMA
jgi:hypothetical protein